MTAHITFNQAGIPAGVLDQGREDGKDDGTLVVATIGGFSHTFRGELWWVGQHPTPDTTSVASFAKVGSTYQWSPTAGVYGTWILRIVTDEGTPEQDQFFQGFAIKQSPTALRIPAPQERGDELASLVNATSLQKRRSWFNKPEASGPFSGVAGTWAPWWRPLADLIYELSVIPTPVPATRLISTTAPLAGGGDLSANRTLSITAATTIAAGSMSASDKTKLDGLPSSSVPTSRNLATTAPLAGGGDLSADRTFSITAATTIAAGSMSASDKTKLDGLPTSAVPTSRTVSTTAPLGGGGDLSANLTLTISAATTIAAGTLSASDKTKLDGLPTSAVPTSRTITGSSPITGGGDLSADRSIGIQAASGSVDGYLASADYTKIQNAVPNTRTVSTTTPLGGGGALSANLTLTISAATTIAAGSMSSSDKTKLDGLPSSAVPTTRNVNTTAPITGGGALSADLTVAISAATSGAAGSMSAADKAKLDAMQNALSYVTVSGTTKTLALADAYQTQETTNGSATAITFPLHATVAYDVGTVIGFNVIGAGQLTLTPVSGAVTLQSSGSELKSARQFAKMHAEYRGSDVWLITGEKTT